MAIHKMEENLSEETSSSPAPTLSEIEKFSNSVEQYAHNNSMPLLSALAIYANEEGLDESEVPEWISERLKSKIQEECFENDLIEKKGVLPI